jgi:hypothetical protein
MLMMLMPMTDGAKSLDQRHANNYYLTTTRVVVCSTLCLPGLPSHKQRDTHTHTHTISVVLRSGKKPTRKYIAYNRSAPQTSTVKLRTAASPPCPDPGRLKRRCDDQGEEAWVATLPPPCHPTVYSLKIPPAREIMALLRGAGDSIAIPIGPCAQHTPTGVRVTRPSQSGPASFELVERPAGWAVHSVQQASTFSGSSLRLVFFSPFFSLLAVSVHPVHAYGLHRTRARIPVRFG